MTLPTSGRDREHAPDDGPIVLGVAGGIGSGKSTVARALAALGWVVIDSDEQAAAALATDEVRRTLVSWWGPGVLDASGGVDRGAVGKIVFADAAQRARLEGLIHPMIARRRREIIENSRDAQGKPPVGVVFDAPLLFEAGLAGECDAVVFVDAPREVRLARVKARRGWDEAELTRREAAQWPLEKKRAASRFVVDNRGDVDEVSRQVARIAGILLNELGGPDRPAD
jgi:dephospho-CoA kinase